MTFSSRIELLEHCQKAFPNGVAVEIGVLSGCFTHQILASWKTLSRLYCVDVWRHQSTGYVDAGNLDDTEQEKRYQQFVDDFKKDSRVIPVRNFSHLAAGKFDVASVDFVYVDGNHNYDTCAADLAAWYPAIKPGGIMAGHDYFNGDENYQVERAVTEFAAANNLTVGCTLNEHSPARAVSPYAFEGRSFVIQKP